jgi:pimeloyl-ACP methyl ester carboxylesterase
MGDRSSAPYLLADMAADAVGLLDHLEVESAHIVGASMGGMIAQTMAIEHAERVRSLTSIMSTTGEPGVGEPTPEMTAALLAPRPSEREAAIEAGVAIARAISSPDHFDEDRARTLAAVQYDRGHNPDGVGRQLVAVLASGSRADGLAALDVPTLVIHGRQDQLVTFSGGERTAELIDGAELLAIDDMGHDMAEVHWPRAVAAITELTTRAG